METSEITAFHCRKKYTIKNVIFSSGKTMCFSYFCPGSHYPLVINPNKVIRKPREVSFPVERGPRINKPRIRVKLCYIFDLI